MITKEILHFYFHYDEKTGVFTRTKNKGKTFAGDRAGTLHSSGYEVIRIDDKLYKSHRLAWLYVYGFLPKQIDHINGVKTDNRIENLRETNPSLNNQNRRNANKNSKSGFKGISWIEKSKKWRVRIMKDYKEIRLGRYEKLDDAIKAYADGAKKYHHTNPGSIKS
jgi:hypothetical protein